MTTVQTMLAVGALVLLTSIMMNFYRIFYSNWDVLDDAQFGIDATSLATSYFEIAQGLAFDEETYDTLKTITSPSQLTQPWNLGPDAGNYDMATFTDFDDFHGYVDSTTIPGLGTYMTQFEVYYVDPFDIQQRIDTAPTFAKRMDVKLWRPDHHRAVGAGVDTVRMFTVMGYFQFQ
jgi:hypothetical protein